jgi:hypothetical protein
MEIRFRVVDTFSDRLNPGPPGPGHRFVFSDALLLVRIDNKTPGNGLPQNEQRRRAGTHSGFTTTVVVAGPRASFFPSGSMLVLYEATYRPTARVYLGRDLKGDKRDLARVL